MFESDKKKADFECAPSKDHFECKPHHHHPHVSLGKMVTKVPVVLAELCLQANVDTKIHFPEPVLEIKDIKKRLKLTQCRLLLRQANYSLRDLLGKISNMQALAWRSRKQHHLQ